MIWDLGILIKKLYGLCDASHHIYELPNVHIIFFLGTFWYCLRWVFHFEHCLISLSQLWSAVASSMCHIILSRALFGRHCSTYIATYVLLKWPITVGCQVALDHVTIKMQSNPCELHSSNPIIESWLCVYAFVLCIQILFHFLLLLFCVHMRFMKVWMWELSSLCVHVRMCVHVRVRRCYDKLVQFYIELLS